MLKKIGSLRSIREPILLYLSFNISDAALKAGSNWEGQLHHY